MPWVPTNEIVQDQISTFQGYANAAFGTAIDALNEIADSFHSSVSESGVGSDPGYPEPEEEDGYQKPTPPNPATITFNAPTAPTAIVTSGDIAEVVDRLVDRFDEADVPEFTDEPMELRLPEPPSDALPFPPSNPAPIEVPEYPDVPEYEAPVLPELRPIELPDPPSVDLSTITALIAALRAAKPTAPMLPDLPDFSELFAEQYTVSNQQLTAFVGQCAALANLCPRLGELLAGDSIGIPAAVAQGLRDRAFAAEDRQAAQAETEALTDWQARGFTLPGGALEAKLAAVRQLNRDKKAQLNRDLWLEEAKLEIENLRYAIQQGIAYEGMLRESWARLCAVVQAIAQGDIDTLIKALDAALSLYRTQMEGWKTEFETIRDQLQVELAKLEVYKSELDAQKLIGQLNQQDIDIYKARWEALNVAAALYKTQVEAANGRLQAELAKLEAAEKQVKIYIAKVGAYETRWKAYGIAADAEKTKADLYESQAKAFAARVDAYNGQVSAAKIIADTEVSGIKLQLDTWQTRVEQYKAELQAELGRIDTLVRSGGLDTDIYKAEVIAEGGYTDWLMKNLDYHLNVNKLNTDTAIKNKELTQNKDLTMTKIAQDALDGIARTAAQLSGSAMSAMNVNTGLSSSSSSSYQETHYYDETV